MPEWTEPRTWQPGELVRAADLNAQLRDNVTVLAELGAVKAEVTGAGTRTSNEWGPLDDEDGPTVRFRTGPGALVVVVLYAQGRTTVTGDAQRAYASYRITRVDDGEDVVEPSLLRSLLWRSNLGSSASFVWLEQASDGLEADVEYDLSMEFLHTTAGQGEADGGVQVSHRRVMAMLVRPPVSP